MILQYFNGFTLIGRSFIAIVLVAFLAGCSFFGGAKKPQPAELQPVTALVPARLSWTSRVGAVNFPLTVSVSRNGVGVTSDDGTVALLDAQSGRDIWRIGLKSPIAAGVGSDGKVVAVVTKANEVVAIQDGRELWRQKLNAQAFTAPFVAGERVFVLAADRSVNAFDGQTGRKLWTQQRPTEPLVLRQSGVMLAVGDTLVVGLAGRLAGLNATSGSILWETPIASPRGINDVERLVDLVGRVSRDGTNVCARAFQASIGCVNAARGNLLWTKPAMACRESMATTACYSAPNPTARSSHGNVLTASASGHRSVCVTVALPRRCLPGVPLASATRPVLFTCCRAKTALCSIA